IRCGILGHWQKTASVSDIDHRVLYSLCRLLPGGCLSPPPHQQIQIGGSAIPCRFFDALVEEVTSAGQIVVQAITSCIVGSFGLLRTVSNTRAWIAYRDIMLHGCVKLFYMLTQER